MKSAGRASLSLLLFAAGLASLAAAYVGLHMITPSDGARLQPGESVWRAKGIVVTPLIELPNGLRKGDLVLAVEGRSLEAWAKDAFVLKFRRLRWQFGQPIMYSVLRDGSRMDLAIPLVRYPLGVILRRDWGTILFALFSQLIATYVFLRRPEERAARVLFLWAASILSATTWSFGLQVSDLVGGLGFWLYKFTTFGAYMLFWIAGLHFAMVFPRPNEAILKYRWVVPLIYTTPYLLYAVYLAAARPLSVSILDWLGMWAQGESALALVYLASMIALMVWNYRVNSDAEARRKIRWIVLAAFVSGGGGIILWLLPGVLLGHPLISTNALGVLVLPFPLALAAAILRHHLFDIEFILNRTLVYGTLTGIIVGLYVLVVGYLGTLFHVRSELHTQVDLLLSLLTTSFVAILFQPLRDRLQRAVNRSMYGERDDPYTVLSRLSQRLEATLASEAVLPTIVEAIAQALKLPYVAIALKQTEEFNIVAGYGRKIPPLLSSPIFGVEVGCEGETLPPSSEFVGSEIEILPLTYQSETVGKLILGSRARGETFSPADRRLLSDLARQVGVAVHTVRLTVDLQRSRQRLVTAREEERRRLRRDLHDGLGPTMASQGLKLAAARRMLGNDLAAVENLLEEIMMQNEATVAEIRRLIYDLRPPALDELGLVEAIQVYVRGALKESESPEGLRFTVKSPPGGLPPLPAAVEVAAYRIALEAFTNVARHARARNCLIYFYLVPKVLDAHTLINSHQGDDSTENYHLLQLEVSDDGIGLPSDFRAGVGLTSMRERTEELGGTFRIEPVPGGGTRVCVQLPLY